MPHARSVLISMGITIIISMGITMGGIGTACIRGKPSIIITTGDRPLIRASNSSDRAVVGG
jgi:hypothetical protein